MGQSQNTTGKLARLKLPVLEQPREDGEQWLEEIVDQASIMFLARLDKKTQPKPEVAPEPSLVQGLNENSSGVTEAASSHPLPEGLEEPTDPYHGQSKEKALAFLNKFKSAQVRGVGFSVGDEENRAMMFHAQWYDQATSFCALRWIGNKWCEVIKPWSNSGQPGVCKETWDQLQPMLFGGDTTDLSSGSLVVRRNERLFVVVYHRPYVCIHEHSVYAKADLLDAIAQLELPR